MQLVEFQQPVAAAQATEYYKLVAKNTQFPSQKTEKKNKLLDSR